MFFIKNFLLVSSDFLFFIMASARKIVIDNDEYAFVALYLENRRVSSQRALEMCGTKLDPVVPVISGETNHIYDEDEFFLMLDCSYGNKRTLLFWSWFLMWYVFNKNFF